MRRFGTDRRVPLIIRTGAPSRHHPLRMRSRLPRLSSIDAAIPYPEPPLVGTMFVLRPFRVEDFDAAQELGQDPANVMRLPPVPAADGAGVVEYLEERRGDGTVLDLVIADLVSDSYLGEVVVAVGEDRVGEVGRGLVPTARGRGCRDRGDEAARRLGIRSARPRPPRGVRRTAERRGAAPRLASRISPRGDTPGLLGGGR